MATYDVYCDASHKPDTSTAYWATVLVGQGGRPHIEAGPTPRDPDLLIYGNTVAELYAIRMGLLWCRENGSTVNLYTDSEAALYWIHHKPDALAVVRRIIHRVADKQLAVTYHQIAGRSHIYHAYAHHACDRLRRYMQPLAFDLFSRSRTNSMLGAT